MMVGKAMDEPCLEVCDDWFHVIECILAFAENRLIHEFKTLQA